MEPASAAFFLLKKGNDRVKLAIEMVCEDRVWKLEDVNMDDLENIKDAKPDKPERPKDGPRKSR